MIYTSGEKSPKDMYKILPVARGEEMSGILVQVESYLICRGKEKKKSRTEQKEN